MFIPFARKKKYMFIDTHCHLNMMVEKEREALLSGDHLKIIGDYITQAQEAQVKTIINVGTNLHESLNSVHIAQQFPSVYATVGVHPCDTHLGWKEPLLHFKKLLAEHPTASRIVGIGETGLDFYHKPFNRSTQEDSFKAHIELALAYNKALVIHVREAGDEVLSILEQYHKEPLRAVIHCFSQKADFAQIVTGWGLFVGIDGPITYPKNQWLRDVLAGIPAQHVVIETDAPFLPPQEYRGKKNSPAYIPLFAPIIAQALGYSTEEIARITTANAQRLFKIGIEG